MDVPPDSFAGGGAVIVCPLSVTALLHSPNYIVVRRPRSTSSVHLRSYVSRCHLSI